MITLFSHHADWILSGPTGAGMHNYYISSMGNQMSAISLSNYSSKFMLYVGGNF